MASTSTSPFARWPYKANRGGHAPGHLREAFCNYLDDTEQEGTLSDIIKVGDEEREVTLNWLIGQLWNCTDIMPGDCCDLLLMERGSTYAQAVRMLKGIYPEGGNSMEDKSTSIKLAFDKSAPIERR